MYKALFPLITSMLLILSLSTACAEQDKGSEASEQAAAPVEQVSAAGETEQGDSLMDQPVDFSSPEAVKTTLQNIREQEGEAAYENLKIAMDYILFYDISIRNDEAKLYKKLDGQTPKQIFARMKR